MTPDDPRLNQPAASAAPPAPDDVTATRVLRQFRVVFSSVRTHLQQLENEAGLGGSQVWALAAIRERPGIGVNELAQTLDVRQPTASNLVKSLVEQGYLEMRKEGADRRAVQLYVRPSGDRLLRRTHGPLVGGVLPQALATIDRDTLGRLESDLATLIDALRAGDGDTRR